MRVRRVEVVEKSLGAGGVGLDLDWVGNEARMRIGALPDPVICTDGSFRVIDETLAMFEGSASGLGTGAIVVVNKDEWRRHPVTAFRFGDATIGFSSAFDVEAAMVSAASDLSAGLGEGGRDVHTDCQSVVSRTDRGGFSRQSGRGHTPVMRHIYRARKGGLRLHWVKSHPEIHNRGGGPGGLRIARSIWRIWWRPDWVLSVT